MKIIIFPVLVALLSFSGCSQNLAVQQYSKSGSHFNNPTTLNSRSYPDKDIYVVYKKGKTGASSMENLRSECQSQIASFAKRMGRSYVILGQQSSNPPFLLGNYPRVEIVFALVDLQKVPE